MPKMYEPRRIEPQFRVLHRGRHIKTFWEGCASGVCLKPIDCLKAVVEEEVQSVTFATHFARFPCAGDGNLPLSTLRSPCDTIVHERFAVKRLSEPDETM